MRTKLNAVSLLVLLGFFCSLYYHYYYSQYVGYQYPYTTFLFRPGDVFRDYLVHYTQSAKLDPYSNNITAGLKANYLPWSYLLTYPLTYFNYEISSKLFFVLSALLFTYIVQDSLRHLSLAYNQYEVALHTIILVFFSYPILFCLDRLNIEVLPLLFTYLYFRQYQHRNFPAAYLFLSIACLIKPYYILFVLPSFCGDFIKRALTFSLIILVLATISFSLLERPISENLMLLYFGLINSNDILTLTEPLYFSASLLEPLRYIYAFFYGDSLSTQLHLINSSFFIINILLALALIYVTLSRKFFEWEKFYIIAAYVIICSHVSFDYKLIVFYIPLLSYLSFNSVFGYKDKFICLVFGLILTPKDYAYLENGIDTSISVLINPIIILLGILLVLFTGISRKNQIESG